MDSSVDSNVKSGSSFNTDRLVYKFHVDSGIDLDIDGFWSGFKS